LFHNPIGAFRRKAEYNDETLITGEMVINLTAAGGDTQENQDDRRDQETGDSGNDSDESDASGADTSDASDSATAEASSEVTDETSAETAEATHGAQTGDNDAAMLLFWSVVTLAVAAGAAIGRKRRGLGSH
ncbi:MAG: hypothetical protein LUC90_06950, partial [Lachnospiraceae bacterium]|nr:hypothetical protein [Lachnospiraceae bacterium]